MDGLNDAFYFVIDKIIRLQDFFIAQAKGIGRMVFLIAVLSAALNYALTGQGLKENAVKIGKAVVFFWIVIFAYPRIIGFITSWTFSMAHGSMYPAIEKYFDATKESIASEAENKAEDPEAVRFGAGKDSFVWQATTSPTVSESGDPRDFFTDLLHVENNSRMAYTSVAPVAVLKSVFLVAGSCFKLTEKKGSIPATIGYIIKGLIAAFFVIFTGVFALLEYLMAFLEFMLVASVGVILLPLSIWEGSKFMSEKFIGAILGFFIKLLFCNIAIFLMLYGFISLVNRFTVSPFSGMVEEFIAVIFTCLFFFYICKSAPGLAQGLLSGTPSLSATRAISAATGAVAAAASPVPRAAGAAGNGASDPYLQQNAQGNKQAFYDSGAGGGSLGSGRFLGENAIWIGTVIPGILETAINTDLPGNVLARVTQNIYDSQTGRRLLIPQGTILVAKYNSSVSYAQRRVQIVWDTLIRPDGFQLELEGMNSVDRAGMSGQGAQYHENWFEYLKAAGIVTLFSIANSAMTETAAKYASNAAAAGIAESNSELVNQLGGNMVGRAMNIQPTLTVENGTLINIMLNKNLYLPPAGGRPVTQKYILE